MVGDAPLIEVLHHKTRGFGFDSR